MHHESMNGGEEARIASPADRKERVNVQGVERALSLGAGAFLARAAMSRRGRPLALALGAYFIGRGLMKRDPVKQVLTARPAAKAVAKAQGWDSAALTTRIVTINRPCEEVYAFWRDFGRLQAALENIERIDVLDEKRSRWIATAPGGGDVEWISEITEDEPGRRIAWKSTPESDIHTVGEVDFVPSIGNRGCELQARFAYEAKGGEVARAVAAIMQKEPVMQGRRDLRRVKQLLETGEIATSKRNRAQEMEAAA